MTKEEIKKSGKFSPGLIDGVVMNFLLASKDMYFVKRAEDNTYHKEASGSFMKITLAKVVDARFLYLQTHLDQEKKEAIQSQINRLGKALIEKAKLLIAFVADQTNWAEDSGGFMYNIIRQQDPPTAQMHKDRAVAFFEQHPHVKELCTTLNSLIDAADYQGLYDHLEGDQPLASASFPLSQGFKNVFGAASLPQTVEELKEFGSLYLRAKVMVEQTYLPA